MIKYFFVIFGNRKFGSFHIANPGRQLRVDIINVVVEIARLNIFCILALLIINPLYAGQTNLLTIRPMSLGGSYVGVADDSNAVYWNPAGIDTSDFGETTFSFLRFIEGISQSQGAFTILTPQRGSFGAAVNLLDYGPLDQRDAEAKKLVSFNRSDFDLNLSYSKEILWGLSVGVGVRMLTSNLSGISTATGFGINAGGLWRLGNLGAIGGSILNLGGLSISDSSGMKQELAPMEINTGISLRLLEEKNLLLTGQLTSKNGGIYISVGGEYLWGWMAFRGGAMVTRTGLLPTAGFGFGSDTGGVRLDYAIIPQLELGTDAIKHIVSFSYRYGSIVSLLRETITLEKQIYRAVKRAKKDEKPTPVVAITEFTAGEGTVKDEVGLLKELFQAFMVQTGGVYIVERSQLEMIAEQQKEQLKDTFGEEKDKQLAMMAGAEYIIVGNFGRKFGKMELRVEMVHVGTGKTILIDKVRTRDPKNELYEIAQILSQRVTLKTLQRL